MTPAQITALIDGTWPAAAMVAQDGWMIRTGAGGGSRVSAATALEPGTVPDIDRAEAAMRKLDQTPIFMIRDGEQALDTALADRGYRIKDPVTSYAAPTGTLAVSRPPPVTCFEVRGRLAMQEDIWADGGIDGPRLAIMDRAPGPKCTIMGRTSDQPAGTLFAAIHEQTAMLHAIETLSRFRRQGVARNMIIAAAFWAQDQGADTVALLVTTANTGANALYTSLGMTAAAGYHYRIKDIT